MFDMKYKDKTLVKFYVVLSIIGITALSGLVVNAWNNANRACQSRWEVTTLRTQYTREGCVVEVAPNRWVRETHLEKDIHRTVREK